MRILDTNDGAVVQNPKFQDVQPETIWTISNQKFQFYYNLFLTSSAVLFNLKNIVYPRSPLELLFRNKKVKNVKLHKMTENLSKDSPTS